MLKRGLLAFSFRHSEVTLLYVVWSEVGLGLNAIESSHLRWGDLPDRCFMARKRFDHVGRLP